MVEETLKRDRILVVLGLTLVTAMAWAWTLFAAHMPTHAGMSMHVTIGSVAAWSGSHAALMFAMWWIMMVAMMLPSAAPFILLSLALFRRKGGTHRPAMMCAFVAGGYLLVWGAFSAGATFLQWGLEATGLLSVLTMSTGPAPAGIILLAAGIYQLTPAKRACLRHCRSPVRFLVEYWHPGAAGAVRMGVVHGTYCVGCCWMLMGVLFAVGVMNPFWIGALALLVLVEKLGPHTDRLRQITGALLIISALVILVGVL